MFCTYVYVVDADLKDYGRARRRRRSSESVKSLKEDRTIPKPEPYPSLEHGNCAHIDTTANTSFILNREFI